MTKTILILFWIIWLLDVLIALLGYQEFLQGLFGKNRAPSLTYVFLWAALFAGALLVIGGSIYLKNAGHGKAAIWVAGIPLILALPYVLFIATTLLSGSKTNWN